MRKTCVNEKSIFCFRKKCGVSKTPACFTSPRYVICRREGGDGSSSVCAKCATKIRRAADMNAFLDVGLGKQESPPSPWMKQAVVATFLR